MSTHAPTIQQPTDITKIPISEIDVWEEANVRRLQRSVDLDELADSMKRIGLLQPIVVQRSNGQYKLYIGQRRYLAAKQLGWDEIAAVVLPAKDEVAAIVASLTENIQRRDISARDKATAMKALLDQYGTVKAVAEELGISDPTVRKYLGYVAVPEELKKVVDQGKITATDAMRISEHVPEPAKAVTIAEKMVEENLTKPQKERVFEAVEEEPEAPVERVFKRAEEKKVQRDVLIVLPEKAAAGLDKAAHEEEKEPDELARDVLVNWLRDHGYF